MVTAKRAVDLPLGDYHPRSMLVVPTHDVRRARCPAIDYHNHLDAQDPQAVLAIMDECGIEAVVNITMRVGRDAIEMLHKFQKAAPERFATYGGWTGPTCTVRTSSNAPSSVWKNSSTTAHAD